MKVAYLGPPGTFTEEALLACPEAEDGEPVAMTSVPEVVHAVERGAVARGMVPIENSVEGSVNITLDTLAFQTHAVVIQREIVLPIRHALLARPGTKLGDVRAIVSHPHATAQCREFLARRLPGVEIHAANSTAEAARAVSEREETWAAIGTRLAADIYGLEVLAPDIEDRRESFTRFVLLGRDPAPPSGADKTSVVCFIEKDRPGSLLAILHEFSDRQINLTKLESRPTKARLGEYCFFIDMEGHLQADAQIAHALTSLRTKILEVKVLGSYPRAAEVALP